MDSIDQLIDSLSEIDILMNYARANIKNIAKYQLFNKISVVLLSTKLEVFIEDFIDEHSIRMLKGHTNNSLPDTLKNEYFDHGIEMINNSTKRNQKTGFFDLLITLFNHKELSITRLSIIRPSLKFNYGKHGQKEIEKLFKRHGLSVFINKNEVQECIRKFNSLISIRNNVIHQDKTPTLTHQIVMVHKQNVMRFVELLNNDIEHNKHQYYNEK